MKHLLDVNVLLAAIHKSHPQHPIADGWIQDKHVALCPLTELGFIRISTHKKAMAVPMEDARKALKVFQDRRKADWIADDLPALDSKAGKSDEVTDSYP